MNRPSARSQSSASLQFTWWSSCFGTKVHRLMGLERWTNCGYPCGDQTGLPFLQRAPSILLFFITEWWQLKLFFYISTPILGEMMQSDEHSFQMTMNQVVENLRNSSPSTFASQNHPFFFLKWTFAHGLYLYIKCWDVIFRSKHEQSSEVERNHTAQMTPKRLTAPGLWMWAWVLNLRDCLFRKIQFFVSWKLP